MSEQYRSRVLGHLSQILSTNRTQGVCEVGLHNKSSFSEQFEDKRYQTSSADGYIVRHATEGDIEGIVALSKRVLGKDYAIDYLAGWLPKVFKDNNRVACVGEKDNTIVLFAMALCGVDCGKTIMAEAARVDPDMAGSGLAGRAIRFYVHHCVQRWPHYERMRSSTLLVDFFDKNPDRINLLEKRIYVEVHVPAENMCRISALRTRYRGPIQKLSPEELRLLLADTATTARLFPSQLISVGFDMFNPEPSSVPYITYFHDNILMNEDRRAISIGGRFPCNDGQSWRYNFSYSGVVDLNTCLSHLVCHLGQFSQVRDDKDVYIVMSVTKIFKTMFGEIAIADSLQDLLGLNKNGVHIRLQYQCQYK